MKTEVAMHERRPDPPTPQTHHIAMAESIRVCPCSTVSNKCSNETRGAAA